MAKCKKCGRKGLFFKVNSEGLCADCAILTELEKKKQEIEASVSEKEKKLEEIKKSISLKNREMENLINNENRKLEEVKKNLARKNNELEQSKINHQIIYDRIKKQAERDALDSAKYKLAELDAEQFQRSNSIIKMNAELGKLTTDRDNLQKKYIKMKTLYESYRNANKRYIEDKEIYLDETFLSLSPTIKIDLKCMTIKQLRGLYKQNEKLIEDCLKRYESRYTTKTNTALYKLMTIALKSEMQNILYSIKFGKLDSSIDSVKSMCSKYLAITSDCNQSIAPTVKKFVAEIEYLFIEAIKIEYEYYVQKERIKEEQRAIREQMKQEAEERKALEQERKRIEKEEQKYQNEIASIKEQLETADSEKAQILNDRIAELENQIDTIEDKKEQIVSLENGKAGHVYIISNIGSFGENVYKIGMTRRIEPMERINELGNASVPFPFDVHGLIFADDAVGLEHYLHTTFSNKRVNKVNLRKEFFKVSLDDIEKVVESCCPSAEFRRTALAEQYRQSLTMSEAASELNEEDLKESLV